MQPHYKLLQLGRYPSRNYTFLLIDCLPTFLLRKTEQFYITFFPLHKPSFINFYSKEYVIFNDLGNFFLCSGVNSLSIIIEFNSVNCAKQYNPSLEILLVSA